MKKTTSPGRIAAFSALALGMGAQSVLAQEIRLWTPEEQPERIAIQQQIADEFEAKTGISVEVIPVTENDLGTRATAAFAAGDMPDIIYHSLQYALPWAEAGILDTDAATEIVEELGVDTFAPGALGMVAYDDGSTSVPVDGWTQMVLYRKDLFDEAGLEAPATYEAVQAAISALHSPPEMYGFVAPTKIDEGFMSQVLEHVFLANGVSPVGPEGVAELDGAKTEEVLNFYKGLVEASPPGDLFWKQSRELYLDGRAAMIIWSPFILDEMAGLRDDAPVTISDDPTTGELAGLTGIVTNFAGPSNPDGAAWGDVRYFGITSDADTDAAQEFIRFSMDEGYLNMLSMAPEGKFPVRQGNADNPTAFTDGWAELDVGVDRRAPLSDLYAAEMIGEIVSGLDVAQRWGVADGQLSLASKIINSQVINGLVREFTDGERDAAETVKALNEAIANVQ